MPHWIWLDRKGLEEIDAWVNCNKDEVELFLNEK